MNTRPKCSIDGCERPFHARTWCRLHYGRWQRTGSPTLTMHPGRDGWPTPWLMSMVVSDGDCWLWQGWTDRDGYGRIARKATHRLYYERFVGPIPEGLEIDHLCHVRHCVNPDHLEAVTHAENLRRRVESVVSIGAVA